MAPLQNVSRSETMKSDYDRKKMYAWMKRGTNLDRYFICQTQHFIEKIKLPPIKPQGITVNRMNKIKSYDLFYSLTWYFTPLMRMTKFRNFRCSKRHFVTFPFDRKIQNYSNKFNSYFYLFGPKIHCIHW